MPEAYILAGSRTPFAAWSGGTRGDGAPGGALKGLDPFDLGAAALKGALERAGAGPGGLGLVVFGNMYHVGPQACYGARYVGLRAGAPPQVPCLTVSMACGSGLHALITAARTLDLAGGRLVAAGGADNVSLVRRDVFVPSFTDVSCGAPIGLTVDRLARRHGIGREDADRWALRSHELARRAQKEGRLAGEIVPAGGSAEDDAFLPEPSPAPFRAAEPLYGEGGVVTRANSHAVVDAASALILAGREALGLAGKAPLGRFVAGAYAAVEPERMGIASVPALRKALQEGGLELKDVDLFEINETFAAQALLDLKELGIPEERVNVNGGSVALGHPFAATGCRQVLALLLELKRRGLKRGAATICVGGGQGVAVVVETV